MIKKDFIQELLIKPTPDDLNIYRRMGLNTYTSPTGARYPLAQDYFSPPTKRSSINRAFVDSLLADEHPDVQENKSKLPPMADPDQPLDFFADPVPPAGIPDIADPQGLTGDIKPPMNEDAVRALKQIPKGLARGTETVLGTVGSMARWVAERATIGNILTRHTDLPYGAGVVAEYLVRKFGPKKPMEFFDKQMTKYAKQGEKWADFWEEQAQKGWEAPDPEVTQAKWRDMPITKGVATISEAAPNYLAAIASSILTKSPQTGLLFISALSGAGAYRRQRKAGAGVTKANAIATLTGAWEYVTEKVPFDEVFKPAKSKFLKMLKLGTLESAQEFVQGIGENFLEYFGYKAKDLKSVPAAVKEGLEHTMDGWVENVVAGFGLGVMGGGIVPKGGLYDSKEKERMVRGEPQREEPGRPVQVEREGEAKIKAGRVLQEQVTKIPPTEAIAEPEKPTEAITKPEAVEVAPLPSVEEIIKLTPESPELEKVIADINQQIDIAFKQNDLDAMRDIVQLTWELPKTAEADALRRRVQILDSEMLARTRRQQAKPPTVAKAEPTKVEKPKVEPEVTDEELSGITKRERRRIIKETASKIEESDIYQTEIAGMDTMAREVGPGYYYINKGYRGEVEAIIGKRKGPGTKIQRMFTFNPNEKRIITLQTGEKTEIGPTPWEQAVQEGLGRGKEGVDETWGEMDISEFVQRVVDSYRAQETIGGINRQAMERAEQSGHPDMQMLAEKHRMLVEGFSDQSINEMITEWAEEWGIELEDIESEFVSEYGTKLRQIKKMEDPDAALEQLATEQIEAEDRQAAADAAREVLEANDIQAEVEQVEEISERPVDLLGRPVLEGGASGKQRGLGELGLEFTKPEVKDPDQLEFGDAIPFERRGRPVGAAITQGQKQVILLAYGADSETGYHEGYHLLRRRLNDKARKILNNEFKGDEEAEARAFAEYVKTGKARTFLRGIWQKLLNILRKIKSGLQGRGFRTAEDIFGKIQKGKIEKKTAKIGVAYETRGEQLRRDAEKSARIKARKARLAAQAGIKIKGKVKAPRFKIKIRDITKLFGKEYQEGAPRYRRKEAPLKIPIKDVTPPLTPEIYPELEDIEVLTDEQITKAEMGEIPIEGEYKSQSDAFNEHLDYFQNRQLPKKSKIRVIQAQIRTVNGKRLSGKISAQKANYLIRQLRKELFITARNEGIALRMTRGGKVSLSVRKAGTFVPEEFAQYGKFKNIRPILGGGQDITRAIQQMDGSLSVKGKLRIKGQAGPLERHVLWPTRDISMQKLKYIKEKTAELKSIFKTKKGSKEDEQVNLVLEQIAKEDRDTPIKEILSRKTLRAIANPKVIQQALGLREFYDSVIEEQNLAREMRDQDPIPYRHNYSPHILRDTTIWERLMMTGKEPKDIKADLPDYIKPNAPFNPRAMAREAGIEYEKRVKSAQNLAESYLVTAAKDIFNTSIVQNNKAFIQQLDAMGYDKSANYLADWTAEAYAGIKPRLDRAITIGRKGEKAARYFNRLRNMAVFPLNFSWSLLTQTSSLALTVGRYGTTNTMQGFVQWLNPKIRKQASEDYYSYVVKSERQGKITRQDAENLIGQEVELRRTSKEIARDISTLLLDQLEKLLTGTSIRAAHLHGQKRGLTGEALKNYASDGGAKTQSMYNDEDKPALLRNLLVKTGAPYQTFAYEVVNTMREWAGRTGTPPDDKLYAIWTMVRFLAAATVFAAIGKKWGNKEIWSWKRPPIPFAEFWLNPIIMIFSNQWIGSASGLTSPVETATRVFKGIDDVRKTGSWRKLRNEMIKYGPGILGIPGGVQISRTVDAIIAYAQGGVKDRKGRLLFEMEDPQDLVQAIFSGVWSTEGGRAYLDIDYKIKNMTDKELRQYRRKNTYQKTQYPKSKGIIKGRPHKGREQLVEKIDKEFEKRK